MRETEWSCSAGLIVVVSMVLLSSAGCRDERASVENVRDTEAADSSSHVDFPFTGADEAEDAPTEANDAYVEAGNEAVCTMLFFEVDNGDESEPDWSCDIPVTSTTGCDDMARCICRALQELELSEPSLEVEVCVDSITVPRGMITLSDICPLSGSTDEAPSLAELYPTLPTVEPMDWIIPRDELRIEMGDGCDEVAAYTVWNEPHHWRMSLGRAGEPFPVGGWSVDEFPLETPPLLTIDTVQGLELATGTLRLTEAGRDQLAALLEEIADVAGRRFLIHTARHKLEEGYAMTGAISSTRDRMVFLVEELVAAAYSEIRFYESYPSDRPPALHRLSAALLAAEGKLLDAACISSCGCPTDRACRNGQCVAVPVGACEYDEDCCLGACGQDGRCR